MMSRFRAKKGAETPKSESTSSSVNPELAAKVLAVPAAERGALLVMLQAAQNNEGQKDSNKAGPGRFYDPKTDKTYRMRRPVRRSTLYMECERLHKDAVDLVRRWCKDHHVVYDPKTKTSKKEDGGVIPADELHELEALKKALDNAKAQFKIVREAEGVKRGSKTTVRDPLMVPTVAKGPDGKLNWADDKV